MVRNRKNEFIRMFIFFVLRNRGFEFHSYSVKMCHDETAMIRKVGRNVRFKVEEGLFLVQRINQECEKVRKIVW